MGQLLQALLQRGRTSREEGRRQKGGGSKQGRTKQTNKKRHREWRREKEEEGLKETMTDKWTGKEMKD